MVRSFFPLGKGFIQSAFRGYIDLRTYYGFYSVRYAGLVKLYGAEHVAVVCYCAARHLHASCQVCEMMYQARAVEEAVLRVDVEVDKVRMKHD